MDGVGGILLTAGISAAMSTFVGVIVKLAIERKFEQAAEEAREQKKRRIRFTELRCAWMWAAGRVLYHVVRHIQNRKPANGDLDAAFESLEKIEIDMKEMERKYAAEAQEE